MILNYQSSTLLNYQSSTLTRDEITNLFAFSTSRARLSHTKSIVDASAESGSSGALHVSRCTRPQRWRRRSETFSILASFPSRAFLGRTPDSATRKRRTNLESRCREASTCIERAFEKIANGAAQNSTVRSRETSGTGTAWKN